MFLGGLPFIVYSGRCAVDVWFRRLDDWEHSVPGPVVPSSPLMLELRQRQLLALLTKPAARRTAFEPAGYDGALTSEFLPPAPGDALPALVRTSSSGTPSVICQLTA